MKAHETLAAAWKDRADRLAAEPVHHALVKPERAEASMDEFRRAVAWYRYWSSVGAA